MTPEQAIADLDQALAEDGTEVELQRLTMGGAVQIPYGITLQAFIRGYEPNEFVNGVTQTDSKFTISPTEIERKGWPGPNSSATPTTLDRRVPSPNLKDVLLVNGKKRTIVAAAGLYMQGVLVRIDGRILG